MTDSVTLEINVAITFTRCLDIYIAMITDETLRTMSITVIAGIVTPKRIFPIAKMFFHFGIQCSINSHFDKLTG